MTTAINISLHEMQPRRGIIEGLTFTVSIEHGHCSVGVSGLSNLYPCIGSVLMKCYDKQKIIGLPPAFILWVCIHTSCYGVSVARGHLLVDSRVRDLRHITHRSVTARRPLRRGSFLMSLVLGI